ncbi:hypothetical protein ES708_21397 [subsurface metagenome]
MQVLGLQRVKGNDKKNLKLFLRKKREVDLLFVNRKISLDKILEKYN